MDTIKNAYVKYILNFINLSVKSMNLSRIPYTSGNE